MKIRLQVSFGRFCLIFCSALALFMLTLAALEQEGMPRMWIGYFFLFGTTFAYAGIGLFHRTSNLEQFFVAGRRVPPLFNGMATAADWISAASFISLVGGLYLQGFDGLAYLVGWTGGYCVLAFLIAPYLRKFAHYTVADFLAARYAAANEHTWFKLDLVRLLAACATILICFIYVIAQIYAVGLITSRFTGIDFSTGIFLGLASILVCSFLGGMRSITWTQITQYLIILLAFLLPTMWLAAQHGEDSLAPFSYAKVLHKVTAQEQRIRQDPGEIHVREMHLAQAEVLKQKLAQLPQSWEQGRAQLLRELLQLRQQGASLDALRQQERLLAIYPKTAKQAQREWQQARQTSLLHAAPPLPQAQPFPAATQELANIKRNNFLALAFCLMLGTAALPHILMRSYTTPSVKASRESVFWTLFFIVLLYLSVPALAVLLKYEVMQHVVGTHYDHLPAWLDYWRELDLSRPVLALQDINHDGIVQWGEIWLDGDILVLASPEIAGLPHVFSGLIAAGALAAALSTADGLLLAISSALSHDLYYQLWSRQASDHKRVTITRLLLLAVAFLAAYMASLKPADILSLLGAAFSLAASCLLPVLIAAVFWRRANRQGAICAMLSGFAMCLLYMLRTHPALGGSVDGQWWHIAPASAAVFGVPAAVLALVAVSLATPAPNAASLAMVQKLRQP